MKALVVDDSKVIRSVSTSILKELNIESEQAVDGKEALDKVQNNSYDFILLDWNMPNMNGFEFFLEAKKIGAIDNNTKVIFCTTEGELDNIMAALNEGASEYIMKPFSKEIIEDKLMILGLI